MMSGVFRVCESKFAGIHRKLVSHEKSLDFHKTSFKIHFLYFLVRRSFSSPRLPLTFCVACGCRSHRTLFCHHSHVLTTFQLSVRCQIRFWHSIERIIPFCCFFPIYPDLSVVIIYIFFVAILLSSLPLLWLKTLPLTAQRCESNFPFGEKILEP